MCSLSPHTFSLQEYGAFVRGIDLSTNMIGIALERANLMTGFEAQVRTDPAVTYSRGLQWRGTYRLGGVACDVYVQTGCYRGGVHTRGCTHWAGVPHRPVSAYPQQAPRRVCQRRVPTAGEDVGGGGHQTLRTNPEDWNLRRVDHADSDA